MKTGSRSGLPFLSFHSLLSLLLLAAALCLYPGCRKEDPAYLRNRDLLALLDAHDRVETKPAILAGEKARENVGENGHAGEDGKATKYVLHGGRGHLFYLEDLRAALVKMEGFDASLALIARVSAGMKAKGIRLLVVPVPTKVEIHPEWLGGRNVPDLSEAKNRFLRGLDSLEVDHLDLRKVFFTTKDSVRLFPRTDTHWDQSAIRLAAMRIAARIRTDGRFAAVGGLRDSGFTDTSVMGFKGDLAEKFRLAESDTVRLQRVGDGRGGFYAEPDSAAIILYGDSFLRQYSRYSAHLGAHLSRELGVPVKTVYSLKGFIEGPDRLRDIVAAYPGTSLIVWAFTSRSLMEGAF